MTWTRNHPKPTPRDVKAIKKALADGVTLKDCRKRFGHGAETIKKIQRGEKL
jgi:hypothetical protein